MEYRPEEARVTYCSKDRKEKKSYDAPEWLAAMGSHIPERGEFVVEGWRLEGKTDAEEELQAAGRMAEGN